MRYELEFESEPFQGYTEFDEFELLDTETSDELSDEFLNWKKMRPAGGRRRPPARPRRRPRRRVFVRRPTPYVPVFGLPGAGLQIYASPQAADAAAGQVDVEPTADDVYDADADSPPDASASGADDGGAGVEPSADQTEFDEWEWLDPEASELWSDSELSFEWMEEVSRSSPDYVRWVQQSLNRIIGAGLVVDGISGTLTRSAVRSFQQRNGLTVDGIVGPITEGALIRAGAAPPPGSTVTPPPPPPTYGGGTTGFRFVQIPGVEKTTQAFRDKTVTIARDLGLDPNYLMAIMSFESNINPQAVNDDTNATGLIQFMPSTAKRLGTSTDALYRMTAEQQLDWVWKYFAPYKGRLKTLEDAYMAVLYPSAIGRGGEHVLFSTGTDAYRFNSVLDLDRDGRITVAEATSFVRKRLPAGYTTGGGAGTGGGTPSTYPPVSSIGINTPLPVAGPGFYSYTTAAKRFGLSKTIQAVLAIGAAWEKANPNGPRLGIGNISLQGGGPFPPHSSHQKGVDVDIRPVRNDGKQEPVTYTSSAYSRKLTQQLVNIIRANGVVSVRTILFNDPQVTGVSKWTGHDDHLHVSFNTA